MIYNGPSTSPDNFVMTVIILLNGIYYDYINNNNSSEFMETVQADTYKRTILHFAARPFNHRYFIHIYRIFLFLREIEMFLNVYTTSITLYVLFPRRR